MNESSASPEEGVIELASVSSPGELAAYLGKGVSVSRLAQLRHHGGGPRFVKIGRLVSYRREDVLAWLEDNTYSRTDEVKK